MTALSPLDGLDDAHRLVYETARRFATNELAPLVESRAGDVTLPRDVLPLLADVGLLGGPFPEEHGGAGLDYVGYSLVCEAIGGVSPSLFTACLTVQLSLVATAVNKYGNDAQRAHYLPALLSGRMVGAFALTEPNTGSDPAAGELVAREHEGGWVLNGEKLWISNGTIADAILVFAQTDPGSRHRGMAAFLVDGDTPGLTRAHIHGKLGLRESDTASLSFADVVVPADRLLGEAGDGFRIAQNSLTSGRLSTASCAVGIGQSVLDACVAYAAQREQWGKPIGGHQLIQELVADMATDVAAARMLTRRAAADIDDGNASARLSVPMAKQFATEAAVRHARNGISLHGAVGYVDDYPVAGLLRDAIGLSLYEGTTQIQKLLLGRELLGVSAFA